MVMPCLPIAALSKTTPELAGRFVAASLKGWRYALDHPDEIIDQIATDLPRAFPVTDPRAYNLFLAQQVRKLALYPIVELGHTNPQRWQTMYEAMRHAGLVQTTLVIDDVVYDPEKRRAQQTEARL